MFERIPYDACPLCGGTSATLEGTFDCSKHPAYSVNLPNTINWVKCDNCGHSFTDGYFDDAGMAEIGKVIHPHQRFSPLDYEKNRYITSRMVARVSNILHPEGEPRWLDIGFGNGSLILTAQEFGYKVTGLEFRQDAIEALRPYISDVRADNFLEMKEHGEFSVISMADVLEHVPYPKIFLEKSCELLSKGGALFISLPAFESPVWNILSAGGNNPYWSEIEHFHNFSKERLSSLLEEFGFNVVDYHISERYRACMEITAILL